MNATAAPPTRLPRYKRTQREVACILTGRDLEILALVESFRLASSEHVQALVEGSGQNILRRLQKLFHRGYLDRIRQELVEDGGSAKMVYAITNKGIRELQKAGKLDERTATDWNAQNRGLHDLSIRHTLLISHIHAVFAALCQTHPDVRLSWRDEGRDISDAIEVSLPEGYTRIPVAPDAFFRLENLKGRAHFFLEADRGTMTIQRFMMKLKAFAAYWRERRHVERFGIRYFRVLTVTTSKIRAANLVAAAEADESIRALGRLFLFTTEDALRLDRPQTAFENIWTMPGSKETHAILASPSSKNSALKEDIPIGQKQDFPTRVSRAS